MDSITVTNNVPLRGEYDIIIAGGGVAGIAAAVAAARAGKKVLLLEKAVSLGGLATIGLINLFVPMCNGRGVQIIKGMAEEFLRLSIKDGYDTIPDEWKNGEPGEGAKTRYLTKYSPSIFSLELTELLDKEGVDLLYDTVVSEPVMDGGHCRGLIVENKSGREYYEGKIIVDTTGDADVLYRAGVPTRQGGNYYTMISNATNLDLMKKAVESGDIADAYTGVMGGRSNLYGGGHPEGMPLFEGVNVNSVTDFIIKNHLDTLAEVRKGDRKRDDIVMLPGMAQFRTTRCLIGDKEFDMNDAYRHCDDSIGAICDFDRKDYLFEVPFGVLVKTGYDNLITAGRTASAKPDYSWDILRVIPPAIITGQAAGIAAALSIDDGVPIYDVDIHALQSELEAQDVMLHFDDSLIPEKEADDVHMDIGHM